MTKPRIYIAIVNFYPLVGGAERQALLQGRALRARGYDATVITLRHDRSWPQRELVEGVPIVRVAGAVLGDRARLPAPLRKLAFIFGILAMGWVLWRQRRSYDLLHVYQLSVLALPAAIICGLIGKPLVVAARCASSNYQADHDSSDNKRFRRFRRGSQQLMRQDRIRGDLEGLERLGKPGVRLTFYLLRRAGAVVVVLSTRMKAELVARGFATARLQVIPNGVDPIRFRPVPLETSPARSPHPVLYVGRLTYQKGVDVLLRAWRTVQEELPKCEQSQLTIIGTGPSQPQLEHLARVLGIADSVEFAGLRSDIGSWLSRSELVVLPSRWEGMPNALLEAMASGLPCVATRVSGSEDIIQHGVNGLLVEPEDHRGLAQALLSVLRDPAVGRQYGRAARMTIEERYSLDRVTAIYLDLYQALCGRRDRPISSGSVEQAFMTTETLG